MKTKPIHLVLLAFHVAFVAAFFASVYGGAHPAWIGAAWCAMIAASIQAHASRP